MFYAGLDVHKERTYGTIIDKAGRTVRQREFENTDECITAFFSGWELKTKTVIESGSCFYPVYDKLQTMGVDVIVAHPLKVKAIASAKIKTDKIDSEKLAQLLRAGLIPESYIPPKEMMAIRELTRHRLNLMKIKKQLKNKIHSILLKDGTKLRGSPFTKGWVRSLKASGLYKKQQYWLDMYLSFLEDFDAKISEVDLKIKEVPKEHKVINLLKTMPGIGDYFGTLIYSEIVDIKRFKHPKQLASYAGLIPSTHASGGKVYHGRITKQGNRLLRWAMVQAAHTAVRYDKKLQRFYFKKRKQKGANKATVAVANKMLRIVYQMWLNNEPYRSCS